MRSLTDKFNELRGLLKNGLGSIRPTGFDPVYYLLFPPHQIIEVKQRLPEWEAQLRVDGFRPHHLSMTEVVNDYFRSHELREPLLAAARLRSDDYSVIMRSLAEHLEQDDVVGTAIRKALETHQVELTADLPEYGMDFFEEFWEARAARLRILFGRL